ncbi:AMSH-like ubiquitin thioesterase 1 [Malania oleifera]|uniref:AMSH-like ubiquitin thioesterase 1 n=1 Tax=Malania oleifera TaxID=397392 RepID=UPI0025AE6717|nr:AMSH-like ubiquitin thioesterase 1 [Malania oleifera]
MRSSSGRINIAASAQKLVVDNRITLRYYYRIADNILKQADIFREEENILDLYIMLLRFSSLVYETIPCHRDYGASPQSKKVLLKKKLLKTLNELEELQPIVQQKMDESKGKITHKVNGWNHGHQNDSTLGCSKTLISYNIAKAPQPAIREISYKDLRAQQSSQVRLVGEQLQRFSLSIPRPREETLSRHSILGPNGLRGQWQPPIIDKGVQYPSNIDLIPVEIPSLLHSVEDGPTINKDYGNSDHEKSEHEKSHLESILTLDDDNQAHRAVEPCSMISFETADIIRQPSPPPVLADVQDLIPALSTQVPDAECKMEKPLPDGLVHSESPLELHISTTMMESFMKLAKSNTQKNLETCGVLAGLLKNRKFYITTLIIPKQESTSDTCQTTNEEEIFEVQDKKSLFPLGWIHTHPSQSCFMSSVDLHTHYSYQIMLPEAIAIVMAPRDASRTHGIFRLTAPGGMSVIRQCQRRGFHPHDPPSDGGAIYAHCTDVYMNPDLMFDVIDLR